MRRFLMIIVMSLLFLGDTKVFCKDIKVEISNNTAKEDAKNMAGKNSIKPATVACFKKSGFFGGADKDRTLDVIVNAENSYNGKYTWAQYRNILGELSKERYKVVPLKDFRSTIDQDKVVVAMRHDSDSHPEKALGMMKIEQEYGIVSTYLFLHSARYYGTVRNGVMHRNCGFDELVKDIYKNGFEVGIHTDLFTMMWKYQFEPRAFIKEEIAYYKKLGIPVSGSAAHGAGNVLRKKLNNMWIFADFGKSGTVTVDNKIYHYGKYNISDFGFEYEAYKLKRDLYMGDIGRQDKASQASIDKDIIAKLKSQKPGNKVIILTHPEHWGKSLND